MVTITGVNLILLWIPLCEGVLFISPNETTWNDITKVCTIATPEIDYKASGNGKEIIVDYPYRIEDGKEVWVGYYVVSSSFKYIDKNAVSFGCTSVGKRTAEASFDENTLALCFMACRNRGIIGVCGVKCFCLNVSPNTYATNCTTGCQDQPNIACGGENHMSLYIISLTEFAAKSEKKTDSCLSFEINNNVPSFNWKNCGETNLAICTLKNGSVQKSPINEILYITWKDATNLCMKDKKHPPTIADVNMFKEIQNFPPSWTGIIRRSVINTVGGIAVKFGYLKQKGTKTVLEFDENISHTRKILCTNGSKSTDSAEDSKAQIEVKKCYTKKRGKQFTKGSDVGVTVGVLFAVIITMVVIVVIVIFIFKRRGKLPSICYRKAPSEKAVAQTQPSSATNNNAYEIPSESAYNQIDEVTLQRNLDGTNDSHQNTANAVQEDNGPYAHTYLDLENFETVTEKDVTVSEKEESNNVYNTLNAKLEVKCNTENAYDTTGKAERKLKGQQDKDNQDEERNAFDYIDDDDYNHTTDIPVKNKRTDNVYSVPDANEMDYGDVRKSSGNDLGEGDPYNHIEIKSKC